MKLIKRLQSQRWPSGKVKYIGLFECPHCKEHVTRILQKGLNYESCGCKQYRKGQESHSWKHGFSDSPLYKVWSAMVSRCKNPNHQEYHRYGGRGIAVCEQWKHGKDFVSWAISSGYKKGLMLDRIDNNNGYSPENCRWVTPAASSQNRRVVKLSSKIVRFIREYHKIGGTVKELSAIFKVCPGHIHAIIKRKSWRLES